MSSSVVVCVGSTGAGKSSTVRRLTGQRRALSSAGVERMTTTCQVFRPINNYADPDVAWVDTVGWEDSWHGNQSSFQELLKLLRSEQLTSIKAIVWNVIPNVRKDAVFVKQARWIDSLSPGAIWRHVIVVGKQSVCAERELSGALKAAEECFEACDDNNEEKRDFKVALTGYRFLEDQAFSKEQREKFESDEEARRLFNVKTCLEVRSLLSSILATLPSPLELKFELHKCEDCGCIEDPRLMPLYCHYEAHFVHPGLVVQAHPLGLEYYHSSDEHYRDHVGVLRRTWLDIVLMRGQRFTCCKGKPGQVGCVIKWKCCSRIVQSTMLTKEDAGCSLRFKCCHKSPTAQGCRLLFNCCQQEQESRGCVKQCLKCSAPWGTPTDYCTRTESHKALPFVQEDVKEEDTSSEEEAEDIEKEKSSRWINLPSVVIARPF